MVGALWEQERHSKREENSGREKVSLMEEGRGGGSN